MLTAAVASEPRLISNSPSPVSTSTCLSGCASASRARADGASHRAIDGEEICAVVGEPRRVEGRST